MHQDKPVFCDAEYSKLSSFAGVTFLTSPLEGKSVMSDVRTLRGGGGGRGRGLGHHHKQNLIRCKLRVNRHENICVGV